jgi:hypothetical protein
MGKEIIRKKILGLYVCALLITTILPITALAGDEDNPEITDTIGDAFGNIDITSTWFSEKSEKPDYLFICMKINKPNLNKIQQTFAVHWQYNGIEYGCGHYILVNILGLGEWTAGEYNNSAPHGGPNYLSIDNGTYDRSTGIITFQIPKGIIGDPNPGDVLTKTQSIAFQRFGLLGQIGFSRPMIEILTELIFSKSLWDNAPDRSNEYGLDYIIQY